MINIKIKNQNGRSMIEMLGVLAIIGVLSVGGIAGYSKAMMKYRINKTIEQITLIAGNVRTFFAPQRNYEDVFDPDHDDHWKIIRKAKLVPEEMWEYETDGTTFKQFTHVFGGTMGLYKDSKTSNTDDKAFRIDLDNIPSEACIELVSQDWSSANIGAVEVDWVKGAKALKSPAEVDEAVEVCEHTDKNQIIFHVDIDVNSAYWKNYIGR